MAQFTKHDSLEKDSSYQTWDPCCFWFAFLLILSGILITWLASPLPQRSFCWAPREWHTTFPLILIAVSFFKCILNAYLLSGIYKTILMSYLASLSLWLAKWTLSLVYCLILSARLFCSINKIWLCLFCKSKDEHRFASLAWFCLCLNKWLPVLCWRVWRTMIKLWIFQRIRYD